MYADPIEWLVTGDPAIAWQAQRDLIGAPEAVWGPIRERVSTEGWGARLLDATGSDGQWPDEGWKSSVWSLLTLIELGMPAMEPRARRAAELFLAPKLADWRLWEPVSLFTRTGLFKDTDLCHLGFWLGIGSYFGQDPKPLGRLAEIVLELQMPDGGWNCRAQRLPKTRHSSFHTTFNVLEGLKLAVDHGIVHRERFRTAEVRALEFMLAHRLYRSDRTGEVVDESFTRLTYPTRWHYRVLRGLDYLRNCPEIGDDRLADPLQLIAGRRQPNGRWPCELPISGKAFFQMETPGGDSRWNTLKAMRVISATAKAPH